jgi:hypothetical protein
LASQTTGEDWSDVSLSLADSSATGGTEAPQVQPRIVDFVQPPAIAPAGAAPMAKSVSALAAAPAPMHAQEQQSRIEAGAYQALFRAPGKLSLASDGTTKNIALSTQ